jgi:glycosyltransferase involved in cell wall biosynthesis
LKSEVAMAATSLPSLSVVVPNYNHARHLETCLSAILRQSVQPLEVIVLDDASTDNSVEVIRRIAAQHPVVRLVQNEKNLGVMPNINKGIQLSRGEYIYVASADDEIVPGLFEKSLRLLAQHPQAAYCCAITEWREVASGLIWHMAADMCDKPCYLSPDEMVQLGKKGGLFIVTSSCVQKREPLLKAGIFPPELRWHADWFAMYVTGFRDGICFVPEILSTANILPGSFYQSGHKKDEHERVLLNLLKLLNSDSFADVAPRIRESGALSMFAMPLFKLMVRRPDYRHFITATFVRRTLRRSVELQAKKCFPTWLARWCLNRFYHFRKGQEA